MEKPPLSLQPSEQAIVQAAATIYAAYVTSGRVTEGKEKDWMSRAIREAFWIARAADEFVRADDEMS